MTENNGNVSLTADVVMLAEQNGDLHVLLVQRRYEPYEGCWALPGGYVETADGETFEQAARRELGEETGLTAPARWERVGIYDAPDRDPRGRVVTVAYLALLDHMPRPTAGDDARAARWTPVADVLSDPARLAFDHHQVLTDAVARARRLTRTEDTAYLVVTGAYEDTSVVRVFGDETTAQQWARDFNNAVPWTDPAAKARVEPVGFTPAGHMPPAP